MTLIWWIRRDLRLTDNAALQAALQAGSVIPAFILNAALNYSSQRRKKFSEGALDNDLQSHDSYLDLGM